MPIHTLSKISHSNGEETAIVSEQIKTLKTQRLHTVHSKKQVQKLCTVVINAIDRLLMVLVDESEILERKIKKNKNTPIIYNNDDERWQDGAEIRRDWATKNWNDKHMHGWIWYTEDNQLLGIIYNDSTRTHSHKIFINKQVADNPTGALVLIRAMKKKLQKNPTNIGDLS